MRRRQGLSEQVGNAWLHAEAGWQGRAVSRVSRGAAWGLVGQGQHRPLVPWDGPRLQAQGDIPTAGAARTGPGAPPPRVEAKAGAGGGCWVLPVGVCLEILASKVGVTKRWAEQGAVTKHPQAAKESSCMGQEQGRGEGVEQGAPLATRVCDLSHEGYELRVQHMCLGLAPRGPAASSWESWPHTFPASSLSSQNTPLLGPHNTPAPAQVPVPWGTRWWSKGGDQTGNGASEALQRLITVSSDKETSR